MDNNELAVTPKHDLDAMPSRKWFTNLPDDRRHASLRKTGPWKLAHDPKKREAHLEPHRCDCAGEPAELHLADVPIREMLEAVPVEFHAAFLTVATATLETQMLRLMKAFRNVCPAEYELHREQHRRMEAYNNAHLLSNEAVRQSLWNAANEKRSSNRQKEAIRIACRQVVRSEYLVRNVAAHIRSDY